jgi:hypothetical protein
MITFINSLTPKCIPAGMKNSRLETFCYRNTYHRNIPTMMSCFPSSGMVLMDENTAPPGASSEGVGQGRNQRVLAE